VAFSGDPFQKEIPQREIREIASEKPLDKPKPKPELTYPLDTTLLINATDSLSGVQDIQISIDNEPLRKYKGPIQFKKAMSHDLTVVANDQVGNSTTEKFKFRIEKKAQ
jgi:hypothetical protein